MSVRGRRADEAFISATTNEPFAATVQAASRRVPGPAVGTARETPPQKIHTGRSYRSSWYALNIDDASLRITMLFFFSEGCFVLRVHWEKRDGSIATRVVEKRCGNKQEGRKPVRLSGTIFKQRKSSQMWIVIWEGQTTAAD